MIIKKLQAEKKGIIIFAVFLQIILMVMFTPANSYHISRTSELLGAVTEVSSGDSFVSKVLSDVGSLLIGFLTIKQFGVVSAASNYCCEKTLSGQWCQSNQPESQCVGSPYEKQGGVECSQTSFCGSTSLGTCITQSGTCSSGSTETQCKQGGGTWNRDNNPAHILQCTSVCCNLQDRTKEWMPQPVCQAEGGSPDTTITDPNRCFVPSEDKGACMFSNKDCRFTTVADCKSQGGVHFYSKSLCTNPALGANNKPTTNTICNPDNGNVYFVDSEGQQANIYNSQKTYDIDPNYWNSVISLSDPSICNGDPNTGNPAQCGLCNSPSSSTCSQIPASAQDQPNYGHTMCVKTTCDITNAPDFPSVIKTKGGVSGNGRDYAYNGEQWCISESPIGKGNDLVGSVYGIAKCHDGQINVSLTDVQGYRDFICGENVTNVQGLGLYSLAAKRPNGASGCYAITSDLYYYHFDSDQGKFTGTDQTHTNNTQLCENASWGAGGGSDCMIQKIDVTGNQGRPSNGNFILFDVCVPRYPPAFTIKPTSAQLRQNSKTTCSIGNYTCTTVWQKFIAGTHWHCIANCGCLDPTFADQMNNLCTSLGDCGGYFNIAGDYSSRGFTAPNADSMKNYFKNGKWWHDLWNNADITGLNANGNISSGGLSNLRELADPTGTKLFPTLLGNLINQFSSDPLQNLNQGDLSGHGIGIFGGIIKTVITAGFVIAGIAIWNPVGWVAGLVVIILSVLSWLASFLFDTKNVPVSFTCLPWQPKTGVNKCSECGTDGLPCTEYTCQALGSACVLKTNLPPSANPVCISSGENDGTAPNITYVGGLNDGYKVSYVKQDGTGFNITSSNGGCISENQSINFTLATEYAGKPGVGKISHCVWSWEQTSDPGSADQVLQDSFDQPYFEEYPYDTVNHKMINLPLIPVSSLDNAHGNPGERIGTEELYIRCVDSWGNYWPNEYTIKFCVQEGADITPAGIANYNPANKSYIAYGSDTAKLHLDLTKPAKCRYNVGSDMNYEDMTSYFYCQYDDSNPFSGGTCTTPVPITGLDSQANNIFIRCMTHPWDADTNPTGVANQKGFLYTIYQSPGPLNLTSLSLSYDGGTTPLNLDGKTSTTVKGGGPTCSSLGGGDNCLFSLTLNAQTAGGAYNGKSICKWNFANPPMGTGDTFYSDSNTGPSTSHSQGGLSLTEGNYNISVICKDDAGNTATKYAIFHLALDTTPPIVTRTYKQGSSLKVVTNELARCYYNTASCGFGLDGPDASSMDFSYNTNHSAPWNSGISYYVKCKDPYGNVNPECAIIVSPSQG